MDADAPQSPPHVLDYGRQVVLRPSIEPAGHRFAVGVALSSVAASFWIFRVRHQDYPAATACGGLGVVFAQWLIFWCSVWARKFIAGAVVEERGRGTSVVAGVVSGAAVFMLWWLVALLDRSEAAEAVATVTPLVVCPILASLVILRRIGNRQG
jgi:hypothetical protein